MGRRKCGLGVGQRGSRIGQRGGVGTLLGQQRIHGSLCRIALGSQACDKVIGCVQRGLSGCRGGICRVVQGDRTGQRLSGSIRLSALCRPNDCRRVHCGKVGNRIGKVGGKRRHEGRLSRGRFASFIVIGDLCGIDNGLRRNRGFLRSVQGGRAGSDVSFSRSEVRLKCCQFALSGQQAGVDILHRCLSSRHIAQRQVHSLLCFGQTGRNGHAVQRRLTCVQLGLRIGQRGVCEDLGGFQILDLDNLCIACGQRICSDGFCSRKIGQGEVQCCLGVCQGGLSGLQSNKCRADITCTLCCDQSIRRTVKKALRRHNRCICRRFRRGQCQNVSVGGVQSGLGSFNCGCQGSTLQSDRCINVGGCGLGIQDGLVRSDDLVCRCQHFLTSHTKLAKHHCDGGRVGERLVSNQVRDDARVGIVHRTRGLEVRRRACLRCARVRIGKVCCVGLGQKG